MNDSIVDVNYVAIIINLAVLAFMFVAAERFNRFTIRKKPDVQGVPPQIEVYKKEKRTIRRIK